MSSGLQPVNPLAIFDRATAAGVDPAALKVVYDLYLAHEANEAKRAWHESMHAAQTEMPMIVQDATNPSTQSGFARLETIQYRCRPIWQRHGMTLSFAEEDCPLPNNRRIVCDVRHVRGHCVRYHRDIPLDAETPKGAPNAMTPPQRAVSTGSYGQRVLTCDIFDIVIARTDHDGATAQPVTEKQALEMERICRKLEINLATFLPWADNTVEFQEPDYSHLRQIHLCFLPRIMVELDRKEKAAAAGGGK